MISVTIDRHWTVDPDAEKFAKAMGASAAKTIAKLEESPGRIDSAFSKAYQYMRACCSFDPGVALLTTWESVVQAMQVAVAMFAVTGQDSGTVECRINNEVRHLRAIGRRPYVNAGNWLTAFWLAVVSRDQDSMTRLSEIPVERLRAPEGHFDEYIYHWVDVLQTFQLRQPGLADKLIATIESSRPEIATITPRDQLQYILYQPINLFRLYVRDKRDEFGPALVEALELHKLYWTADEDRANDPYGRIALGPLAIARFAYDDDFPIDVESDYLPAHLLRPDWSMD
ncbi:immunity 49 family protein [Nocardia alni]|uniref:immunity 49 family protein n=1 Tax=Nocardia alni TaxID=2815723 RepID=UPI001C23BC76|nr:immunity 49 family protein [Nocardia alni]